MTPTGSPGFRPLTGVYEPSAIQQLPDGRFVVVEDEKLQPFSLVSIDAAGGVGSVPLGPAPGDADSAFWKLADLEGLAMDAVGRVYAITSHSRDGDGDEKKSREKLVRFRIEGNRVLEPRVVQGLKPALAAAHPVLAAAAGVLDVKNDGGLNIEALEISPDQQRLLIGFRSPLLDRRAILASIDNPAALFEAGEAPRISPTLDTLDLDGHGIRGLAWVPALGGYLIASGPVATEPVQFRLWFWSGAPGAPARRVEVPGLPGFEHAEGVCPAVIDGRPCVLIVSDDGSREAGRCARYLLLDIAQLRIAP
jgi:hypothetical protein